MLPREQLGKASRVFLDAMRESASKNIAEAVSRSLIKIDTDSIAKFNELLNASLEEGYMKAMSTFMRQAENVIASQGGSQLAASKRK